jgi:hypothetical protein
MFVVDEVAAAAVRDALERGGELSAVAELRRGFPLITDNADARRCVRAIASWNPWHRRSPDCGDTGHTPMGDQIVSSSIAGTLHQEAKVRGASPTWIVTTGGSARPGPATHPWSSRFGWTRMIVPDECLILPRFRGHGV